MLILSHILRIVYFGYRSVPYQSLRFNPQIKMGLNLFNQKITYELDLNKSDAHQMTSQLQQYFFMNLSKIPSIQNH